MLTSNRAIVETIVRDLLFNMEDFDVMMPRSRALSILQPYGDVAPGGDCNIDEATYCVKIQSVRLFKMAVGFVLKGAAFRGTAQFFLVAQSVTHLGYLKGGSDD